MYFRQYATIFIVIAAANKNVHSAPTDFNDVTTAVAYEVTTAVSSEEESNNGITTNSFGVITAEDDVTTIANDAIATYEVETVEFSDATTADPNDVKIADFYSITTSTVTSKQNGGTLKEALPVNVENTTIVKPNVNNDNTLTVPDINIVEPVNDKKVDINASNLYPMVPDNVISTINYESGEKSSIDSAVNYKKSAKHLIKSLFDEDYSDYLGKYNIFNLKNKHLLMMLHKSYLIGLFDAYALRKL